MEKLGLQTVKDNLKIFEPYGLLHSCGAVFFLLPFKQGS